MNAKRGRPPKLPDVIQVDEVDISGIGNSFLELSEKLKQISTPLAELPPGPHYIDPKTGSVYASTPEERGRLFRKQTDTLSEFLGEFGDFFDNLDYWRHVLAEYAARADFSHRSIGEALGVNASTITRWVNNPVGFDWSDIYTYPE